jgi:hypothetical protein
MRRCALPRGRPSAVNLISAPAFSTSSEVTGKDRISAAAGCAIAASGSTDRAAATGSSRKRAALYVRPKKGCRQKRLLSVGCQRQPRAGARPRQQRHFSVQPDAFKPANAPQAERPKTASGLAGYRPWQRLRGFATGSAGPAEIKQAHAAWREKSITGFFRPTGRAQPGHTPLKIAPAPCRSADLRGARRRAAALPVGGVPARWSDVGLARPAAKPRRRRAPSLSAYPVSGSVSPVRGTVRLKGWRGGSTARCRRSRAPRGVSWALSSGRR